MTKGLADHEGREGIESTAEERGQPVARVARDGEVGTPSRERGAERGQQVVRDHRTGGQRHRRQQDARQRNRPVPHQVDAVGVVQVRREERVPAMRNRVREPADEPAGEKRVAAASADGSQPRGEPDR